MTLYFHALVKLKDGNVVKYRNITTLNDFLHFVENNHGWNLRICFIYSLPNREAKKGDYVGYYTTKKGFVYANR